MGNCWGRDESALSRVSSHRPGECRAFQLQSQAKVKNTTSTATENINGEIIPSTPRDVENLRQNSGSNVYVFTYNELKLTTKNFRADHVLGEGGFGIVYKGYIDENVRPGLKALPVAVKVLNQDGLQGHKEWLAEVIYLGQLSHPHLVKLVGTAARMNTGCLFMSICLVAVWKTSYSERYVFP